MIGIVDYGAGNLRSVQKAFESFGCETAISADRRALDRCSRLVLPGVGSFGAGIAALRESGLAAYLSERVADTPLLGICLGMQLLFEKSFEYGEHAGLSLIPGEIVTMEGVVPVDYKVPHIGWNELHFPKNKEKSPSKLSLATE